ncbi:MAG: hypothetical protein HC830_09740 [Bacteroidetes bacterium]|nr:hypothetical protein [Bacteroidota bacterium]
MIFAIAGFYLLYQEKKELFPVITVFFLLSFWIISSWTEWWYGASYSSRPFITSYVLLALPLGLTLKKILTRRLCLMTFGNNTYNRTGISKSIPVVAI